MVNKIQVKGVAIREGVSRNNIMYTSKELEKFAPTLANRPILKDHESKTDNVIGKVKEGFSLEGGKQILYSGWVKEDGSGIVDKIKDGRIQEVSIGAVCGKLVKESEGSDVLIAKDMVALELSTTPTPGVMGTSIMQQIYKKYDDDIDEAVTDYIVNKESIRIKENKELESYSMEKSNDNQNRYKEVRMETQTQEKKTENIETSEKYVKEAVELKAKLEEAQKVIESMKEVQRQEAIASYKVKCEAKKIPAKDMANMTMETIRALIDVVDSMPSFDKKEEAKEVAKTKTMEIQNAKVTDNFDGFVIESSSLGGLSFYKAY